VVRKMFRCRNPLIIALLILSFIISSLSCITIKANPKAGEITPSSTSTASTAVKGDCMAPEEDILAGLQKNTRFVCYLNSVPTNIEAEGSLKLWAPGYVKEMQFSVPGRDPVNPRNITWAENTFSLVSNGAGADSMDGKVCYKSGKLLVSFDYECTAPADNLIMSVRNMPLDPKNIKKEPQLWACENNPAVARSYITRLDWKMHTEKDDSFGHRTWDARLISLDWTKGCVFCIHFYK
jgi:hypothetical protein